MPDETALLRALAGRGSPPPSRLEWHESLASTNDRLKDLAREGAPAWTVVIADRQTAGRGRAGRFWVSPPGGLYLSALLQPRGAHWSVVPLAAGVAVADAAAEHGLRAELKWPNDVLASGGASARKLAGILAEAASGPGGPEWVVLGIGVNVARGPEPLPAALLGEIAFLDESPAGAPALTEVAASVLAWLRVWYDALDAAPARVVEAWRARAAAWWGETIEVRTGRETLRGRLVDIDEQGALLVAPPGGPIRRIVSGEVERVRPQG